MNRLRIQITCFAVALIALLAAFPAAAQCNDGREGVLSDTFVGSTAVEWRMLVEHKAVTLTVSAPCGLVVDRTYEEGQSPFFDLKEIPADDPDGRYHWSLRISPHVDPAVEKELAKAHESGDGRELEYQFRQKGLLPAGPFTQSGTFTVFRGAIVPPDLKEEGAGGKLTAGVRPAATADDCPLTTAPAVQTARLSTILPAVDRGGSTREVAAAAETPRRITGADQVIPDDLIVQGSLCVGFDCVNNEAFSFDTIRLKENNLRIKFEDTSVGSFPTTDWELIANDSASGGATKFSIRDVTANTIPFTVRGGSPANSLFVASTGRVGLRTSSPVLDLHINTSNTPGIRLEQNNSGGFTAQTWDIAGNEANFFVRDVTGGSRLPFRIRPQAPTSSIDISADGDVGIGTASPQEKLHVENGRILVQNTANPGFRLEDDDGTGAAVWDVNMDANGLFQVSKVGTGGPEVLIRNRNDGSGGLETMDVSGSIEATSFNVSSSRTYKQGFAPVDAKDVLARVAALPVSRWSFKSDQSATPHIGPMAEDFAAMFGVGNDPSNISLTDASGVALAAIQGLHLEVREKEARIQELTSRQDELRAELAELRALVASLAPAR